MVASETEFYLGFRGKDVVPKCTYTSGGEGGGVMSLVIIWIVAFRDMISIQSQR